MAELTKGFIPFDYYNAGNDYNPLGYGTSRVMTLSGDTISAYSGTPSGDIYCKYDVLRNVTDTTFNKDAFIKGVWRATSDKGGGSAYEKPEILEFKTNIPEFNTVEITRPFTSIDITSKLNRGSASGLETTATLTAGTQSIELFKTTDTEINVSIVDPDIMDIINQLIADCIPFSLLLSTTDGKNTIEKEIIIKSVHYSYYGWISDPNSPIETELTNINVSVGHCAKAIDYDARKAFFGAFYPQDEYMYIATPIDLGLIKSISNGAAIYSVGTSNTDFIRKQIEINNIAYYLYVLQYSNHGSYNMLSVFDKGV